MENFRGTKGEWHNNEAEVRSQSGLLIGHAYTHLEVNQSLEERNANARLISTAPELLEALKDLLWLIEHSALNEELLESINRKAKPSLYKALGL